MSDSEDYTVDGTPDAHAASHESGGSDEVDVTGLQPADHASRHENGGADEINASGLTGVGHQYVDRGDPSGSDFTLGDLTADDAWHDLDLSSIVPAGAVLVHVKVALQDDALGGTLVLRKNGNSNSVNAFYHRVEAVGFLIHRDGMVSCDSGRIIEYNLKNTTWVALNIVIKGWWI